MQNVFTMALREMCVSPFYKIAPMENKGKNIELYNIIYVHIIMYFFSFTN